MVEKRVGCRVYEVDQQPFENETVYSEIFSSEGV
jgi:hypothetical protein